MDSLSEKIANTGSLPSAPPPPPEVKIRTMRSDLESMAKSGGGLPHFQNVQISGLAMERVGAASATNSKSKSKLLAATLIILGLILVGGVIYFAYQMFLGGGSTQTPLQQPATAPAPQASPSATPSAALPTPAPTPAGSPAFVHASFFKTAPDQTLTATFPSGGAVQNATDLETYSQRILATLASASATASTTFMEINAKASDGHDLSATELLAQAGINVIDPATLAANFNPDVTFFVYHGTNDFWPGYILSLQSRQTPAAVSASVKKLEFSPSVSNFFLSSEGTPAAGGFKDAKISGVAVRELSFSGNAGAIVTYGWAGNYLILSSSPAGFAEAVKRLQ